MDARPLSARDQIVTVALSSWFVIGIFLDGWAHNKLQISSEGFFTPWHAALYSGFVGSALWIASRVSAAGKSGSRPDVCAAYRLGLVGAIVFACGGLADMVWHSFLGVEAGFEALMSPPHLVMLVGALLVLSTPARAAWHSLGEDDRWGFLPVIVSAAMVAAAVAFFQFYLFSWVNQDVWTSTSALGLSGESLDVLAVAGVLVTTPILVGPPLVLARRWRLPLGSVTGIMLMLAALSSSLTGFDERSGFLPAVVAGLAADASVRGIDPRTRTGHRTLSLVLPATLWIAYFLFLWQGYGLVRPAAVWTGAIVLAIGESFAIGASLTASGADAAPLSWRREETPEGLYVAARDAR